MSLFKRKKKASKSVPQPSGRDLSKADKEMIDELDYEDKKAHKPYDKYERHWDEA